MKIANFPFLRRAGVLLVLLLWGITAFGQVRDTVSLYVAFRQGDVEIDPGYLNNAGRIEEFDQSLRQYSGSGFAVERVVISGGASAEGSDALNQKLSVERAQRMVERLSNYFIIPEDRVEVDPRGVNWDAVLEMVRDDSAVPAREEVIRAIESTDGPSTKAEVWKIAGGQAYEYLYKHIFPYVREGKMTVYFAQEEGRTVVKTVHDTIYIRVPAGSAEVAEQAPEVAFAEPKNVRFVGAVKTNLLMDAVAVPNLGCEISLGRKFSLGADAHFAWWYSNEKAWFHQTYGADAFVRWWFGRKSRTDWLTGHHLGIYGQALTYDFEWGKEGQQSPKPGYAAGLEYGYSAPIGKHLNLDFSIGAGYYMGKYYTYLPIDTHFVWQATYLRRWIGPTKAEISLVWLFGNDPAVRKGGRKK